MARLPTGPYKTGRTGCYGCKRESPSDGSCGVRGYPCVHRGLDMFADAPDVFAPETGVVVAVADGKSPPYSGYGPGLVMVLGQSGFYHLLSHLNLATIRVKTGQPVFEGQKLAQFDREIGHTHYEVRRKLTGPSETNTISPLKWLADQQRPLVAATEPTTKTGQKFLIGLAVAAGFVGASALALKIAKSAAYARPSRTRALRPAV